jgi:hypothetical protein
MADENPGYPETTEHDHRDLTSERTRVGGVDMLGGQCQRKAVCLNDARHTTQINKRGRESDIHVVVSVLAE